MSGITSREMQYYIFLNDELGKRYEKTETNTGVYFKINGKDGYFDLHMFPEEFDEALVIEYADNLEQAEKNLFPWDGDRFYPEDMTKEEMLAAMIKEIES